MRESDLEAKPSHFLQVLYALAMHVLLQQGPILVLRVTALCDGVGKFSLLTTGCHS